jgi:hypothetical protein
MVVSFKAQVRAYLVMVWYLIHLRKYEKGTARESTREELQLRMRINAFTCQF